MSISRRDFLGAGLVSVAAICMAQQQQLFAQVRGPNPGPEFKSLLTVPGEDGSKLWMRYVKVPTADAYLQLLRHVVVEESSPTMSIVKKELLAGLTGMIGLADARAEEGAIYAGTTKSSVISALGLANDLKTIGEEGYLLRSVTVNSKPVTVIASPSEIGVLYGAFHLLRLVATCAAVDRLNIAEAPAMKLRMANHWDNPTGSIERGYAGQSLIYAADPATGTPAWNSPQWRPNPRLVDYARAAASVGMNGVVLNNVNATPTTLATDSLKKIAQIADLFRPYGLRVFLSGNFAAPKSLGKLPTADPNDPQVQNWWKGKADEIYTLIPDFGGLLVKANSEGQPGPKDYNRTHAEGANCLAAAFAPHQGRIIWRAFVYDDHVDADRVKRAYKEFMPLDGKFLPNVLVQIKNGPLDFQPREPFSPLFGALTQTGIVAEVQPSEEYLGQAKHLVYLGTMWEEFLQSDTYAKGPGSTVAKVLQQQVQPIPIAGFAGVLNPGLDPNWTGHHFCQANWYALGRFAWNPNLSAQTIADEWTRQTFTNDSTSVKTIVDMMMGSRETFLNYSMPLGLHHMIGGDHYAPRPENARDSRPDWTAAYYHRADAQGIGFDRTRQGTDYVDQYFKPLAEQFNELTTCPEKLLLWFHHLPWDHKLKSGKTLWAELIEHYDSGVAGARALRKSWATLKAVIDDRRHQEVDQRLEVQTTDALAWRNRILAYFASINGLPLPELAANPA